MSFKTQIDNVIEDYGTNIELVPTTITYNDYGDETISEGTPITIKAIPYNYTFAKQTFEKLGVQIQADQYFIIEGDTEVDTDYLINYDGKTFKINSVEKYVLQGVTLAKLLVVSEKTD